MAQRKSFLLRLPPELMDELSRWAKDELRSVNAQIEYVLRDSMRRRRRKLETTDEPGTQPFSDDESGRASEEHDDEN